METKPFKELSESRKHTIVDEHIEHNWYETTVYEIEVELEKLGFSCPSIQFSGFSSQGDGASFTCNIIDLSAFLKREKANMDFDFSVEQIIDEWSENDLDTFGLLKKSLAEELVDDDLYYATVDRTDHRYVHENTVTANVSIEDITIIKEGEDAGFVPYQLVQEDYDYAMKFLKYLDEYLSKWVKNKCKEIYSRLEEVWNQENEGMYNMLTVLNAEWFVTTE
jgi:hypothetical protein